MLGVNQSEDFKEAVRLYLMLHADHEGGSLGISTVGCQVAMFTGGYSYYDLASKA